MKNKITSEEAIKFIIINPNEEDYVSSHFMQFMRNGKYDAYCQ